MRRTRIEDVEPGDLMEISSRVVNNLPAHWLVLEVYAKVQETRAGKGLALITLTPWGNKDTCYLFQTELDRKITIVYARTEDDVP